MKYVNPPDSFLQDELGKFCLYSVISCIAADGDPEI